MRNFPVFKAITGNIREETGSRQTASTAIPPIALYSAILPPITADGRNVTK
jgi:hypothetical protein